MRGTLWASAALALGVALLPAQAQAADHLECILATRSDAVDAAVFEAYRKGSNIGEALMGLRMSEIQACVQANKWSGQATESATRVLLGEILAAGLRKEMTAKSLPAATLAVALKSFMDSVGRGKARRAANGDMDQETITELVASLLSENVLTNAQMSNDNGVVIGEYMSAYANTSVYRQDFEAQ
ncbi:MAG: hypothetical protein J7498_09460 [Sphingobium sp.]|nr:hypothetical protein [Sphingobium sp.]